jgi:N-acetylglutamate synthase-like GNAT family acetyltransferase
LRTLACGHAMALETIVQARFLRLTSLAVSPQVRQRAFSAQLDAQIRGDMLSPRTTTIEDLQTFASARLRGE